MELNQIILDNDRAFDSILVAMMSELGQRRLKLRQRLH